MELPAGNRIHKLPCPGTRRCFSVPVTCCTLGLPSEPPLTCFATAPHNQRLQEFEHRVSSVLRLVQQGELGTLLLCCRLTSTELSGEMQSTAKIHPAVQSDASKGRKEPNVLMWKSQILNYAAEPGVLAHANSHCQRGNENRTEAAFC